MKKLISFILSTVCWISFAFADGDKIGNGGGGLSDPGAGIHITMASRLANQLIEVTEDNLLTLNAVLLHLRSFTFLEDTYRIKLMENTRSENHRYYLVTEPASFPGIEVIKKEYADHTGFSRNSILIYAVTDFTQPTTYLLPEFLNLTFKQQMEIIFHEVYWSIKPQASLSEVLSAEIAFKKLLDKDDFQTRYHFAQTVDRLFGVKSNTFKILTKKELGALRVQKPQDLFGESFVHCIHGTEFSKCLPLAEEFLIKTHESTRSATLLLPFLIANLDSLKKVRCSKPNILSMNGFCFTM